MPEIGRGWRCIWDRRFAFAAKSHNLPFLDKIDTSVSKILTQRECDDTNKERKKEMNEKKNTGKRKKERKFATKIHLVLFSPSVLSRVFFHYSNVTTILDVSSLPDVHYNKKFLAENKWNDFSILLSKSDIQNILVSLGSELSARYLL